MKRLGLVHAVQQAWTRLRDINWRRGAGWAFAAAVLLVVALYGGQALLSRGRGPVRLTVYAFSTQEEVLTQAVLPAFEAVWEAESGRDLIVDALFGASGTLAEQINLGAPADVALLSNEQHVNWLKLGRRVRGDTQAAVVSYTPMVIVTRPGNPAGIADFDDLAQPGLRLLHADPRSSGAGDWAVLAEYGSALRESGDAAAAEARLRAIWDNVELLAPSARASLTLFELGAGDALVTYESDARLAMARGVPLEIILPSHTIVAQHVAVLVDANLTADERPAAKAFIHYLLSEAGQASFTRYQLRPANLESPAFPALAGPFTIQEVGGWSRAYSEIIETLWQSEIEPRLDLEPAGRFLDDG